MAQAPPQSQWVKLRSWAAHNRVHDLLLVTCQYIYTEDVDDARVLLAGLDYAAETVNDVASLEGIIDTLAGFRPWFLRAVRPEDFFNLRLSIIRYMAVSELRRQLPPGALGEITEEDVSGIDLGPYWELLDRYFPRDIRKRKFKDIEKRKKGREDDSAWQRAKRLLEYEVDRVESDRLMLVDVLSQKDKSTPDRTKILKLLDVYGDDSWVEKLKKITRQTEERLLRPPPDLFGEDSDSAVRAARGLDVGRVWDPEVLGMPNDEFRQLLKRHIPALFNEYTAGPAALEAATGNAHENDVPAPPFPPTPAAPRTRGATKKRAMDSGAKADKGKERVALEEKASRLKRSVRAKGGDPIEDQPSMRDGQEEVKEKEEGRQPQRDGEAEEERQEKDGAGEDEQKEREGSEPERQGRATRRSPAARAADQAPPAGVAVKSEPKANPKASGGSRLRYDDPRREGLEISFNDSQYQGDEDDEDATENELEEDEDEIEDDKSDDSRRASGKRRRLATPSKARRYTLGPGGSSKKSKAARAGKGGGQRIRWTREEVEGLERAVREGHLGQWAYIRDNYAEIQPFRTSVDIKDKWRNLQKARAVGPA